MHQTRPLGPAVKAEVAADHNGLTHTRITEHDGRAHVFTTSLNDLENWHLALGGRITHQPAGPGVTHWSLTTDTDHGHGTPVTVHALAPDTDHLDPALTDAVDPAIA